MRGTRVDHVREMWPHDEHPGYYCPVTIDGRRSWHCVTPNGHAGNLANHEVVEHEDGTITVTPSILVSTRRDGQDVELYHGFLTRGEWTE